MLLFHHLPHIIVHVEQRRSATCGRLADRGASLPSAPSSSVGGVLSAAILAAAAACPSPVEDRVPSSPSQGATALTDAVGASRSSPPSVGGSTEPRVGAGSASVASPSSLWPRRSGAAAAAMGSTGAPASNAAELRELPWFALMRAWYSSAARFLAARRFLPTSGIVSLHLEAFRSVSVCRRRKWSTTLEPPALGPSRSNMPLARSV
mmetsp:Transcript_12127/g.30648  ORF Transcript_12127/g.30648 Transcript_12127/m.30648 type:complete len:207 (-) Transcript_12127:173-793(-)